MDQQIFIKIRCENAEKEVQDTSCPGVWGCPPAPKAPQDWGTRGLMETISVVLKYKKPKWSNMQVEPRSHSKQMEREWIT